MKTEVKRIALSTLGSGAASELFDAKMKEVLDNIADVNTPYKAARTIVLTVKIHPNEARDYATLEISADAKLAKYKGYETHAHIGQEAGELVTFEEEVKQPQLPLNVTEMPRAGGK
jgi:hypothetical protein